MSRKARPDSRLRRQQGKEAFFPLRTGLLTYLPTGAPHAHLRPFPRTCPACEPLLRFSSLPHIGYADHQFAPHSVVASRAVFNPISLP